MSPRPAPSTSSSRVVDALPPGASIAKLTLVPDPDPDEDGG